VREVVSSERFPELTRPGHYDVEIVLPPLWLRPQGYTSVIKVIAYPDSGSTERFYSHRVEVAVESGRQVDSIADRVLAPRAEWSVRAVEQ